MPLIEGKKTKFYVKETTNIIGITLKTNDITTLFKPTRKLRDLKITFLGLHQTCSKYGAVVGQITEEKLNDKINSGQMIHDM